MKHECAAWHNQYSSRLLGNYQGLSAHAWGISTLPGNAQKWISSFPAVEHLGISLRNRLGTKWNPKASPAETEKSLSRSALVRPLLEYCAQFWPMLYRKGVGQGPEKGLRGDPRSGEERLRALGLSSLVTIFWGGY